MKVIDVGTPVITLRDKDGNETNMLIHSYDVYGDEIVIKTQIRETELTRGWVGDMICYVAAGRDHQNGDVIEGTDVRDIYRDVLLRSVKIDSAELQEAVTWSYTFLKD
jgi:hypothetical protein